MTRLHDRKGLTLEALVILIMLGLLVLVLILTATVEIPKENQTLFTSLASGVVGTGVGMILSFLFSSTRSSRAKDDTIHALTKSKDETI